MITDKETQSKKILNLLKSSSFVTNSQLNGICYRYSARIHELRKDGWNIERSHIKDGLWRYWLVRERQSVED